MPPDPVEELEGQTRKERIDNRLTKRGWTLARFDPALLPNVWFASHPAARRRTVA